MGSRILDAVVALAVLLSAAALVLLFVRPFVWPPADASGPVASSSVVPAATASASAVAARQPIGSYLLPTILRPQVCLGLELGAASYPTSPAGEGTARVTWWANAATDPGNREACSGGIGELHHLDATVTVLPDRTGPEGPPLGYTLHFALPLPVEGVEAEAVELTLLTSRSTADRLQALDSGATGFLGGGLVFERVPVIAPSLVPAPSPSPSASASASAAASGG